MSVGKEGSVELNFQSLPFPPSSSSQRPARRFSPRVGNPLYPHPKSYPTYNSEAVRTQTHLPTSTSPLPFLPSSPFLFDVDDHSYRACSHAPSLPWDRCRISRYPISCRDLFHRIQIRRSFHLFQSLSLSQLCPVLRLTPCFLFLISCERFSVIPVTSWLRRFG